MHTSFGFNSSILKMEDITDFLDFFSPTWKLREGGWRENNLEKQTLIVLLKPALGVTGKEIPSSPPPLQTPRVLSEHRLT